VAADTNTGVSILPKIGKIPRDNVFVVPRIAARSRTVSFFVKVFRIQKRAGTLELTRRFYFNDPGFRIFRIEKVPRIAGENYCPAGFPWATALAH